MVVCDAPVLAKFVVIVEVIIGASYDVTPLTLQTYICTLKATVCVPPIPAGVEHKTVLSDDHTLCRLVLLPIRTAIVKSEAL